jgi:hypothetical protein
MAMKKKVQTLDYESSSAEKRRLKRRRRIRRFWQMIFFLPVTGIILYLVSFFIVLEVRSLIFDVRTSESKILGKTPQQIIASFGTPEPDSHIYKNQFDMSEQGTIIYHDGSTGEVCRIEIIAGVATRVEHFSK